MLPDRRVQPERNSLLISEAPTSTPTDPQPPLPLPIHIECLFDVSVGGGGRGGSLGWSHKIWGDKWAYRTWGVGQSLRGNRRYCTMYTCTVYHYPSKAPPPPPPLKIANQHPLPSPWERSGGLHISLLFGSAFELLSSEETYQEKNIIFDMGIKFCTLWYHILKKSKVYGRKIR